MNGLLLITHIAALTALALMSLLLVCRDLTHRQRDASDHHRAIHQFLAVQELDSNAVMETLADCICRELSTERVYICLREQGSYVVKYDSQLLSAAAPVSLSETGLCIRHVRQQRACLIPGEVQDGTQCLPTSQEERSLLGELHVRRIAALRDGGELIALVLLSDKERGKCYTASDSSFLEVLCPIASIALKNAGLYEKLFREARVDSLTGVLNYGSFSENVAEQFCAFEQEGLSLLFVDMDDFKLYNQLYGVEAGDAALRTAADCIRKASGGQGTVYRTSGKVFAVLLPRSGGAEAQRLAEEIHTRLADIHSAADQGRIKALTASIGICTAPENASSAKELMDNADLAAYNAKKSGKDRTLIFRGGSRELLHTPERTQAIVEQVERGDSEYRGAMAMISALTAAIDAKDHYTFAHSQNVAFYAASLAVGAGLNDDQVRMIYAAGLLHDIGKISIPETILNKQGGLNREEYGIMKDHVNGAIEMIRHLPDMDYLIPAALGHHERWDGKGYPRGIAGSEIPVSARCLSIADGFDAMITDRPYRKGLPVDYALNQIERGAGSQFDPQLSVLFINLVRTREISVKEHGVC